VSALLAEEFTAFMKRPGRHGAPLDTSRPRGHRRVVRCHACGDEVALATGERVGFRDTCDGCGADLHVCLNCRFHDPAVYNECREPNAERVADRERANRCDYFAPSEAAGAGAEDPAASARARLDALFRKP